jgi:toxin ParE1/3/4
MVEVRWTPQATEDLDSIVEFIARDSPQYARLFVLDIFQTVERISKFPRSGRVVPELKNPVVREVILGQYRLVYRVKGAGLDLLTIYHGARLLDPSKLT